MSAFEIDIIEGKIHVRHTIEKEVDFLGEETWKKNNCMAWRCDNSSGMTAGVQIMPHLEIMARGVHAFDLVWSGPLIKK